MTLAQGMTMLLVSMILGLFGTLLVAGIWVVLIFLYLFDAPLEHSDKSVTNWVGSCVLMTCICAGLAWLAILHPDSPMTHFLDTARPYLFR